MFWEDASGCPHQDIPVLYSSGLFRHIAAEVKQCKALYISRDIYNTEPAISIL
jgi:hypothetical protein